MVGLKAMGLDQGVNPTSGLRPNQDLKGCLQVKPPGPNYSLTEK